MMDRSISHWHDVCFQNFGDLSDALSASEKSEYHEQMPMSFVIDQSGRFNVWAGNIGAQKRGSTSLDYRLRDASHIKDQVVGQLKFLAQRLEDGQYN